MRAVLESFTRLAGTTDLVLIEGAGRPAEINLREGDIANMGFAEAAGVPVVLVGDIDRGGFIAQIVGTQTVLSPEDADRIKAFVINKFRGDPRLFDDGLTAIEQRTGWPALGVIPWFPDAWTCLLRMRWISSTAPAARSRSQCHALAGLPISTIWIRSARSPAPPCR